MKGLAGIPIVIGYFLLQYCAIRLADVHTKSRNVRGRRVIFSLSIAASGSTWLYFGSPGYAATHGIEFVGLYLGIVLSYTLGFPLLLRIVALAKSEGITSISDFIGARYGKSFSVAAIVTLITTMGLIPYISLQMTAIHYLFDVLGGTFHPHANGEAIDEHALVLLIITAIGCATISYSTRSKHIIDRSDGLLNVLAIDSVIKLAIFILIGLAVVFFFEVPSVETLNGLKGLQPNLEIDPRPFSPGNLFALVAIGAASVLLLPSQFHLLVVENRVKDELTLMRWLVPLLLLAGGVFVLPLAQLGPSFLEHHAPADFYFMSVPLAAGHYWLGLIAFLGGLSAATTMVFFPSYLLSIMISNDLVLPLLLRRTATATLNESRDFTHTIANLRSGIVAAILITAFAYQFTIQVHVDFASLALVSAIAMMQLLPPFLGALAWRGGTARGARWGMLAGFSVWAYTMVLPTIAGEASPLLINGPFGILALRPHALFGLDASGYVNGLVWSLAANVALFIAGSLSRSATPLERIQASVFIAENGLSTSVIGSLQPSVTVDQLKTAISNYIGAEQADYAFKAFHTQENIVLEGGQPADFKTVHFAEQLLSGIVGSPSARMILSLAMGPTGNAQRRAQILLDHVTGALAQNRHLLQTALDQMDQGISVFDPNYRLSCWNTQFRLMLDLPEELQRMGASLDRIVACLFERGDLLEFRDNQFVEQFTSHVEPWRIRLNKTGQTIEIRSNSMPDGGLVTTLTDVTSAVAADNLLRQINESLEMRVRERTTELTLANQQLAKAQQRAEDANIGKTRFLADAGHDILQPLNAARLYSSSLMERLGNSREKELVNNVDSSLEAVESIISALLDISRLDTGALKPVISHFRLDAVLQDITRDFAPIAEEKGLRLSILKSSVVVKTDRNLLRRLIQNLVSNAIKYSRSGKILVGIRRRGTSIELQVCDTGIGMPKSKLDDIFREFTRLSEGMKVSEGHGLGLSIVERIAKILDLSIGVSSTIGKGSVFTVTLPVSNAPPAQVFEEHREVKSADVLAGLKIICIDDNELSLAGMQELLTNWGCKVTTFGSARTFRSYCMENGTVPDVLLMDYDLDNENGLDLIGYARSQFDYHIGAALVTADRSDQVRARAFAEDVSIISKPVRPAMLRALLSHFRQAMAAE